MAAMMSATLALMHNHAVDGFMSVSPGVINRDGVTRLERMIINACTVIVDERHISAVVEPVLLMADTEADVV